MNYELEQVARSQLARNEKLLWSGHPRRGLRLRGSDAVFIPFSLMWGGFAFFWEASVLRQGAPGFMALWGIPFVLVGIYIILGRFFVDAWMRSRTHYALTDQRAIIISGLVSQQVKSLPLRSMSDITLKERADGSGSIVLGLSTGPYGWFAGSGWPGAGRYQPPTFEMIENVRNVHTMLRDAQASVGAVGT